MLVNRSRMKRALALHSICFLLLAGWFTAASAQTNHNFARWEKEISTFEQMDRTNPPPKGGLLFIGSSTIRFWTTLAQDLPGQPVINRGFGGSEIVDSTYFADRVIVPYKPRMVFLRAGGNDIFAGKSPEEVFQDFKGFEAKVHSELPQTQIIYIALTPSVSRWGQAEKEKALNEMVKRFVSEHSKMAYIECYDLSLGPVGKPRPELFRGDKLHFNAEGYKLLAERVRSWLSAAKN
jgi:lysophospholipase L1-like esterase